MKTPSSSIEWLETDGIGGFASGTASGIRTRRYQALLLSATTPPTGRIVLVNGFDAWIETPAGSFSLTSQHYAPDIIGGNGSSHIERFTSDPWPQWLFKFEDGTQIEQELLISHDTRLTQVCWKVSGKNSKARLFVRPFLSGRDYHSLHKENPGFRFDAEVADQQVRWSPYPGVPGVVALSNGRYTHEPHWYRNFRYAEESARGLDDTEDLAAPGVFEFDLAQSEAVLLLTTPDSPALAQDLEVSIVELAAVTRETEQLRREKFSSLLHRAGDAYIVKGRFGKTIMAGYPWFTDWGRDTFIALRGLCLASGRIHDAREILLSWAGSVSEGMLPNRFPDRGEQPEFNSVDASLWFVIAVYELFEAFAETGEKLPAKDGQALQKAVEAILEGYSKGTRFGIRMDADGLLAAGENGVQLTWMDAKVGDWVVTPRIGKPVEIQALWLNALRIGAQFSSGWQKHFTKGLKSFQEKFWNEERECLFDVVDANHQVGQNDKAFRPNQIFAVGGLPFALIEGGRALSIVSAVEESLLTPVGLRTLARGEPGYRPRYEGGVYERDGAYHQGTVWPWLMGPFVEAWVRVHGNGEAAKKEARARYLAPMLERINASGFGHIAEIADAEEPHTFRGCPFQAWSVGEALRLDQIVLAQKSVAKSQSSAGSNKNRSGKK